MKDTSAQSSTTRVAIAPTPVTGSDVGRWTHLAGVYDKAAGRLGLYVDGVLVSEVDRTATPWSASGRFAVGRGFASGVGAGWWNGNVADVQVFDRVLVPDDFTGQLASDPDSGGFDEPGILSPVEVGSWNFELASPCYVADLKNTCEAPGAGAWDRWLALSRGATVGAGQLTSDRGLWLDDTYFPDEGYSEATQEYGRSAYKAGATPPDGDGNEFTVWQETPVLNTAQSFTISAWVMPDSLGVERTAVSQRGAHESAAWLKFRSTIGKWHFVVTDEDSSTSPVASVSSTTDAQTDVWAHLVGVYDAENQQIRLYVNGDLEGTAAVPFRPFASSGPLLVGRTLWHDALVDQWTGGIDDLHLYQSAMTDAAVSAIYHSQLG
jgi:hypothetical protein